MAGTMTIRELLTRYSFKADTKPIRAVDRAVDKLRNGVARLDDRIKQGFARIGKAAVAGAGIASVAMIKMASDAEESESKFEAVFKEQADATRQWSETVAQSMGRSGFKLREFAASLQGTFVPMGFARDQAADLSTSLVELGTDVASFQNKSETDVLRDFQSALVGNTETVRKYGIVITEARLKEKMAEMAAADASFARQNEQQQKILARYTMILEGTADAHGDAIRTAGSFANQMRGLRARIERVAITAGSKLLPKVTAVVSRLTAWIDANEDLLNARLEQFVDGLVTAFTVLGEILSFVKENWDLLVGAFGVMVGGRIAFGVFRLARSFWGLVTAVRAVKASSALANTALGASAFAAGGLKGALVKIGAAGAALGAGWVIGKKLDEWTGLSDKLAKALFGVEKRLVAVRVARRGSEIRNARLEEQARRFAELRAGGVGAVESRTGGRVRLDREGVERLLRDQAGRFGISSADQAELLPRLLDQFRESQRAIVAPVEQSSASMLSIGAPQITVNVPPGTDATQARRVAEAAGAATKGAMRSAIGDVAR